MACVNGFKTLSATDRLGTRPDGTWPFIRVSLAESALGSVAGPLYARRVTLADVTADGILAAIAECDRLGREDFLQTYGYSKA